MVVNHEQAMRAALLQAQIASDSGDVPVGAVVVHDGQIIAARHNERETSGDPTAHAEILALQDASVVLGRWRLTDCTLLVTLEPCIMCAGAVINARIGMLVYATADLRRGAAESIYNVCNDPRLNHTSIVKQGVCEREAKIMIANFFKAKRFS